jgi:RimJ/RimL family protein N-acetyltransferase
MNHNSSARAHPTKRFREGLKRYGLLGVLRVAGARARGLLYLKEEHHWYQLDLRGERPHRDMPEGFRLVRATEQELPLLDTLPTVKLDEGERRLGEGASLWLLLDGDRAAFACWIFYGRMPVPLANKGMLELPAGAAGLEDSVTSPDYRGRGLAPAAWSAISDRLVDDGYTALITKVAEENVPSRRAVEKAGFEDIALMRTMRMAARRRIEIAPRGNDVASHLAEQLSR